VPVYLINLMVAGILVICAALILLLFWFIFVTMRE